MWPASRNSAAEPIRATAAERSKAFEWFQSLGYPDVAKAQFVRVANGDWSQSGDDPPQAGHEYGFLLSEQGDHFSVLTTSLQTHDFTKTRRTTATGQPVPEHKVVAFEVADLPKYAAAALKSLDEAEKAPKENQWRRFGEQLFEPAELFFLAWACRSQGHDTLAADVFDRAARIPDNEAHEHAAPRSFLQRVSADIAHAEMWKAVVAFGHPSVSRSQLLERFTWIVKNFPHSKHAERAKATAALLTKMVEEDRAHAAEREKGPAWEKLSLKQQIAELIFQLRDQNGQQWSQPGECDIFMTPDGKEDSPAHRLVNIGYDAVPQLIDALGDTRFTRSVGYHRDFYFSHNVLTVGDCAKDVLERIAGRSFYSRTCTNGYMVKDGETQRVKKEAGAWYAEFLKKGEKQTLIDATLQAGDNSVPQAARLVQKYPDAALPALTAAARAAKNDWLRTRMIQLIGELPGEQPQAFLLNELKHGPFPFARLAAAKTLHEQGRPEAVAAMIERWKRPRPAQAIRYAGPPPPGEPSLPGPPTDDVSDTGEVAQFLAGCGRVEAIEALAGSFARQPVDIRLTIVSAFGDAGNVSVFSTGGNAGISPQGAAAAEKDNKPLRAAILGLLINALDDTAPREGLMGSWNGKSFTDPRICDVAGAVLNQLDAARFPFDLSASLRECDRSRVVLKNVRLKEQGRPELPLPTSNIPKPVADDALRPLVDRLLAAPAAERAALSSQIEKLGLGAIPGLTARAAALPPDDAARAELERLAGRLAGTVDEIHAAAGSLPLDKRLSAALEGYRNKPLDSAALGKLILEYAGRIARPVHGIRVSVARAEDGGGTTLTIDLLNKARAVDFAGGRSSEPGKTAPKDRPYCWNHRQLARVGRREAANSSGVGQLPTEAELARLFGHIQAAPGDRPAEISLTLVGEWRR